MESSTNDSSNGTEITNGSEHGLIVSLLTVYVLFVVVIGGAGNLLTIYAIVRVKRLRKNANILIASLALADCCTIVIALPIVFSRFRFTEMHRSSEVICKVSYYLMVVFVATSTNMLQVVSANRYFMITQPRHTYMRYWGKRGTAIIIAAVWIYSIFLVILPFFGFGEIDFVPELGGCGIVETNKLSWWYKTFLLLVVVESCGIATPTFFFLTFKKIRTAKRRLHAVNSINVHQSAADIQTKPRGLSKEEMAITKMSLVVFFCFLLCWSPYFILHLTHVGKVKPGGLSVFCLFFAFSNSLFNPFIYAGMNKNFRKAFRPSSLTHPDRMPTTIFAVALD